MSRKLQLIVEGDGDVLALPVLVRRIFEEHSLFDASIANPVQRRGDLPKVRRRFSDFFQAAALEQHPILCVLDFDCEDCLDALAEEDKFRNMANMLHPGYPFAACFIVKEYESLFLCDPATTRAVLPRIRSDYAFPEFPESIRDAKGELSSAQEKGWSYKPTVHQAKLSAQVDLPLLRLTSPSYRRLETAILSLIPPLDIEERNA